MVCENEHTKNDNDVLWRISGSISFLLWFEITRLHKVFAALLKERVFAATLKRQNVLSRRLSSSRWVAMYGGLCSVSAIAFFLTGLIIRSITKAPPLQKEAGISWWKNTAMAFFLIISVRRIVWKLARIFTGKSLEESSILRLSRGFRFCLDWFLFWHFDNTVRRPSRTLFRFFRPYQYCISHFSMIYIQKKAKDSSNPLNSKDSLSFSARESSQTLRLSHSLR